MVYKLLQKLVNYGEKLINFPKNGHILQRAANILIVNTISDNYQC